MRGAAAFAAVCAVLAAGACTAEADEPDEADGTEVEPGTGAVAEAERLYQMINEGRAIEDELTTMENRVAKRCMEDAGFFVDDPGVFQETDFGSYGAAGFLTDAPLQALPTPEEAEKWGFGIWTQIDLDSEGRALAEELLTPEARVAFNMPEGDFGEPDSTEWDAEGEEYQAAWIAAYTGAPAVMSEVKGPEADSAAPMGGCQLQMVETIYGEPYNVEAEGEDGSYTTTHEPSPMLQIEEFEDNDDLIARIDGEDVDFETCLIDSGYEDWELDDDLALPLWPYFGSMYNPAYFEEYGFEEGVEVPEVPEDVPGDFSGVLELERAMAVDFAACGQESGLREALEQGWAAMLVEAYQPIETEMVGWQEEMQGHLDSAQDYLQE